MSDENAAMRLAIEAGKLARSLPRPLIELICSGINACNPEQWPISRARILQNISHPLYRTLAASFLDCWQSHCSEISPQSARLALLTAAESERAHREHQTIDLVWTGPDVGLIPLRRTEQALLEILQGATRTITIVSYAVYNAAHISEALVKAANRGVVSNVIIETPNQTEGQHAYNTLQALGPTVASRCNVYFWPVDKRPKDPNGRPGILHVKCAVADSRLLFLSSANLTEYAFTLNMELGVLIKGVSLPEKVEDHFQRLIQSGALAKI